MESHLKQLPARKDGLRGIDLGGGCGGWLVYLQGRLPGLFAEIALSDSSLKALEMAGPVLGKSVRLSSVAAIDDCLAIGFKRMAGKRLALVIENVEEHDLARNLIAAEAPPIFRSCAQPPRQR